MRKPKKPWIVGESVDIDLATVKPNPWNPNRMAPIKYAAIKAGFREVGWLRSDSLLIWGTDEHGKPRNLIINGEHRWRGALELGWTTGPAVVMMKMREADAKKLTIQLDSAHGDDDAEKVVAILKSISSEFTEASMAEQFGFKSEDVKRMLAEVKPVGLDELTSVNTTVHTVPLYLEPAKHAAFMDSLRWLSERVSRTSVSDTVMVALEQECQRL